MKITVRALLGIAIILTLLSFNRNPNQSIEDSFIEVYFSNKLEFNDLIKIKLDLSEKGIRVNYKKLEFTEDGKLSSINYKVTADKVGGSDQTDSLTEEIGFIINTSPKPRYGIIVGTKSQVQARRKEIEMTH